MAKEYKFLETRYKADCENTQGSYICQCEPGFEQIKAGSDEKYRCKDIDECLDDPCELTEVNFCCFQRCFQLKHLELQL